MGEWFARNFEHVLFVGILVGRLGDVGSTWLVTPKLLLEANPVVRRLRWPFGFATLLLAFVAYWSTAFGMVILVMSFFVTASNLRWAWLARALGEVELLAFYRRAAGQSRLGTALALHWTSCAFLFVPAVVLLFFHHDQMEWAFWWAGGLVTYVFAMLVHGSLALVRLHRKAAEQVP